MAYDQSIIDAILQRASQVKDPKARDRYTRAALQTGIVESGLQNLSGGDADSAGWRQERASLYPDPTNIKDSVNRFFDEAAQHDHGQPSWQLAADVQRPAAQYRGRYKDVAQQAAALLGGGNVSSLSSSGSTQDAGGVSSTAPSAPSGQASDFTGLLGSLLGRQQKQQVAQTALAPPAFATGALTPAGFRSLLPAVQSQAPAQDGLSSTLSLLGSLQGPQTGQASPSASSGAQTAPDAPSSIAGEVHRQRTTGFHGSGVLELIYNGGQPNGFGIKNGQVVNGSRVFSDVWGGHTTHVHVAAGRKTTVQLGKLAEQMGLVPTENPSFGGVTQGAHVNGSLHYAGEATDVDAKPGDPNGPAKLAAYAKAVEEYNRTHRL